MTFLDEPNPRRLVCLGLVLTVLAGACARSDEKASRPADGATHAAQGTVGAASVAHATSPCRETPAAPLDGASVNAVPGPHAASSTAPAASSEAAPPTWVNHPSSVAASGVSNVPIASAGQEVKPSALAGSPGYTAPSEEDLRSVREGRRPAHAVHLDLANGFSSAPDLARAILDAINAENLDTLRTSGVTFEEFETILWPEFPQSRPSTNLKAIDAWEFLYRSNLAGSSRGLRDWHDRGLTLDHLTYSVGLTPFTNFNLYRGLIIYARTAEGDVVGIDFVRAIIERNGRFKIYRFTDKPDPMARWVE